MTVKAKRIGKRTLKMNCSAHDRPSARLRVAIKDTYETFARYSPGLQLATCHCDLCLEPGIEERLLATPPKQISFKLLSEYTWALSGSKREKFNSDEYRHFLPRYFHFIAYGLWPNPSGDWQPTLRALGVHAYRERFPKLEIDIIDEYFDALLQRQLERPIAWASRADGSQYPYSDVNDLLNTFAIAGASMSRLLAEWEKHMAGSALLHAACIVDDCVWSREIGTLHNDLPGPWWDECPNQARILKCWLFSLENAQLFRTASDVETDLTIKDFLRRAAAAIEG
jgi:hypothetical protein